jgi:hypothetical protein
MIRLWVELFVKVLFSVLYAIWVGVSILVISVLYTVCVLAFFFAVVSGTFYLLY